MCEDNYPQRRTFAYQYLHERFAQPDLSLLILFTDEAAFNRDDPLNLQKIHVWAHDNPISTRAHACQQRFILACITNDFLLCPYLLPQRLDCNTYRIFQKRYCRILWLRFLQLHADTSGFKTIGRMHNASEIGRTS